MGLSSVPEYVIKKGKLRRHRYGKKSGNKKYYLASQLKKKCKKRHFQRKHDGFLRSQKFRFRLIEHHRDEEVCQDGMLMRMKMTLTIRHNKNTSTQEQWIVHNLRQSTITDGVCEDNTSHDPFARCKVCNNLAADEIDEHRIQSDYKKCNIQRENCTFDIAYACWKPTTPVRMWQPRRRAPSTQSTWTAQFPVCSVSLVLVVMTAHNIVAQVSLVRVISW